MLILAGLWLMYTLYRAVCLVTEYLKHRKAMISQAIELFCDLCLGVNLLLWGLTLYDVIMFNHLAFAAVMVIYLIGKIIIRKINK